MSTAAAVRTRLAHFDAEACRAFLVVHLDPPASCAEIRILEADIARNGRIVPAETYKKTVATYGDDVEDLIGQASRIHGVSAYITVNPLNPALKCRANKLSIAKTTAKDEDVACIRHLYLDCDAKRPDGISSTNEGLKAARDRAHKMLADHPELVASARYGCSGNGYWILVTLPHYPNDEEHRALIARVTDWFSARYSDHLVEIDAKTKNPGRVMPLIGTMKCKGVNTLERPHRLATLESPRDHVPVPFDLKAWAALHVPVEPPTTVEGNGKHTDRAPFTRTTSGSSAGDLEKRVIAYLATIEPAVSGQRGHDKAFGAACRVGPGFDLTEEEAYRLIDAHYNKWCDPPWSEKELRHKIKDAYKKVTAKGKLLNAKPKAKTSDGGEVQDDRPEILISHEEHRNVDEAVAALAGEKMLFQRGGALVTILADCKPKPKRHDPTRPPGSLRIAILPNPQIRRLMSLHAQWKKYRKARGDRWEIVPAHPPATVVDEVATLGNWPGIRPIEGITETPTLRPDGSLISRPGYDEDTGLWFAPNGQFPPIRDHPSLDDARAARDELYGVVADFPFANDHHKATWLAALLTPMARWAIDGACPLFLFDANCPGTGKTKLCDIIAILATGREMPRGDYPGDQDEMQKMLVAVAMAADRLILFDNVETGFTIGGSALDRALTARTMKGRILGKSQMTPELPVDVVFYATGNNLNPRGDALRRVVPCRLETMEQRPEERKDFKIKGDLLAHVKLSRGRLVAAALTILRAYIVAGRPDQNLAPMDYTAWCGLIRNAVKWVAEKDPCESRTELIADDEETNVSKGLLSSWKKLCLDEANGGSLSAAEALAILEKDKNHHPELRAIFSAWSKDGKLPPTRVIGNRFNKIRGRNIDGSKLDCSFSAGIRKWFVKDVPKTEAPPDGASGDSGASLNPSVGEEISYDVHARGEPGGQVVPQEAPGTPETPDIWVDDVGSCVPDEHPF